MEVVVSLRLVGIDDDLGVTARILSQQRRKAIAQFPLDIRRGAVVDLEEGRHRGGLSRSLGVGASPRLRSRRAEKCFHAAIGFLERKTLRVEILVGPLQQFPAFRPVRLRQRRDQLLVARRAAAILGRTRPRSRDAGRRRGTVGRRRLLFDQHHVVPIVAEIVGVEESRNFLLHELLDRHARFVLALVEHRRIAVL
jgi:hypothetical protein